MLVLSTMKPKGEGGGEGAGVSVGVQIIYMPITTMTLQEKRMKQPI